MDVIEKGGNLYAQWPTQPSDHRLLATSASEFFFAETSEVVRFSFDEQGQVSHAMFRQGGTEHRRKRSDPPAEQQVADIDTAVYNEYIGLYFFEATPEQRLTVSSDHDRLFIQFSGDARLEVFPESETTFFNSVLSGELQFQASEPGTVDRILSRHGQEFVALRLESGT